MVYRLRFWLAVGMWAAFSLACALSGPPATAPPVPSPPPPTATSPPTPAPSATPLPSPTPSPTPPSGPCANPLYPFLPANRWRYRLTTGGEQSDMALTVAEVTANQATLNSLSLATGITTTSTVDCRDGAILNFPTSMLSFILGGFDGELNLQYVDGIFAPAAADFQTSDWNTTWDTYLRANGTLTVVSEGETYTLELHDSPVHLAWRTARADGDPLSAAVSVPAGEFPEAVEIRRQIEADVQAVLSVGGSRQTVNARLVLNHTLWFQPGLGLLRQRVDRVLVTTFGVTFPVESDAVLELVDYHTAGP